MRYLIILFCCAIIISCSKTDLPDAPGTTLSKIDYYSGSSTVQSDVFTYNAQNKLIQVSRGGLVYDLVYNAQGQLASATLKVPTSSPNAVYAFVYTHDANGRIIKKATMPGLNANYSENRSYAYDATGKLIADSQYYGNIVARYTTYTYNNNGDVIKYETFSWSNNSFITYGTETKEYDNKLSPYHQTGNLLYYITSLPGYLSKSNVVITAPGSGISDTRYGNKYYSNGLLRTSYSREPYFGTYERAEFTYKQP